MLAHTLWQLANRSAAARFHRAARNPADAQAAILDGYLRGNAGTYYGRQRHFESIRSADAFQQRVPISTYQDYELLIERILGGEENVLTRERVRYLAPSSGSAGAEKLIPYTGLLLKEFNKAIAPWMDNLFTQVPAARNGPAYWSITPQLTREQRGKVPIGFEDDAAYLGRVSQRLVESTFAVPSGVRREKDIDSFRYRTLLHLLAQRDLSLISVWHPSFLTLLLDALAPNWQCLLHDISNGAAGLRKNPARAEELRAVGFHDPAKLWPKLALVSCWADANARVPARQLGALFPNAILQPKGLIATEAFSSFPLITPGGTIHPLAITSHFFEFLESSGRAVPPHQAEINGEYTLLVTTGGGLYRYNTHDRVRITGRYHQTPCLQFLGKEDHISDLFGEKLNALFVSEVLARLQHQHRLDASFVMLAPAATRYALFIEPASAIPADAVGTLDELLSENPHYRYCRNLGQLDAPIIQRVRNAHQTYLRACHQKGQQLGNIKPTALHTAQDWPQIFGQQDPPRAMPH